MNCIYFEICKFIRFNVDFWWSYCFIKCYNIRFDVVKCIKFNMNIIKDVCFCISIELDDCIDISFSIWSIFSCNKVGIKDMIMFKWEFF